MCQLVAYLGERAITPLLIESLRYQEGYFGGQATGLATITNNSINLVKRPRPVNEVIKNSNIMSMLGNIGMAHSRYSLKVFKSPEYNRAENAHPWLNEDKTIALMHNGIINNYKAHWKKLQENYIFKSYSPIVDDITDSEVAIHLLDFKMKQGKLLPEALKETANELSGMVLLSVFSIDEPDTIYITNWMQACYLGVGEDEAIFSSSKLGLSHVWDDFDVFHAPRNSFIKLSRKGVEISQLCSARNAPDPYLNPSILRDKIVDHLKKKGAIDSVAVLISLEKEGFRETFNLEEEEWKRLLKIGYGDQNQLMENLNQFASDGFIHKKIIFREEGGVKVPRIFWYI